MGVRRSRNPVWLMNDGVFVGINMGADNIAEHEWGINRLQSMLNVDENNKTPGIEKRRCKPTEVNVLLKEDDDTLNLLVMGEYSLRDWSERTLENSHREWNFRDKEDLVCCWCSDSFIIRTKGEKNFKRLRELHEKLLAGEVAVWLGGGNVFQNPGLCLAIINKVSKDDLKVMKEADEDKERLTAAALATGIQKKIDEANDNWTKMQEVETGTRCFRSPPTGYYALSPAWLKGGKSKYKVQFWLNPRHQDKNESGWFTVEQLEEWLQGRGPVIKRKK